MFEIKKPRIGMAGVMCTPFRGDKEGNYAGDLDKLELFAKEMDFDYYAVKEGIYNIDQAKTAARELQEWKADFILLQTSSFASGDFIYPFTELTARLGLWAVPEGAPTSEGGLPLNSFTAANLYNSIIRTTLPDYNQPVKWFLGHPGQPLFDHRLAVTVNALRALINLPGKRIALIGGVAPSFDNLIIENQTVMDKLGIEVEDFDLDLIIAHAKELDNESINNVAEQFQSSSSDFSPDQTEALEKSARIYQAIQNFSLNGNFDGVALSCWPQFQSDYGLAVCSVMGQLNSTGLIASCEGDLTSAVSMLVLRYLTQGDIVTVMDLVSIDDQDESVLLWHCGPTSPELADENGSTMQPLWLFDGPDGERTGLHNDLVLKPGRGTVLGFTTNFERMLILGGEIDNHKPSYMGSRGWLKNLSLNGESISTPDLVQTIMKSGYQHHYPFAYGELSEAALELCGWLGTKPIQKEIYTSYVR